MGDIRDVSDVRMIDDRFISLVLNDELRVTLPLEDKEFRAVSGGFSSRRTVKTSMSN